MDKKSKDRYLENPVYLASSGNMLVPEKYRYFNHPCGFSNIPTNSSKKQFMFYLDSTSTI